VGGGVVRAEGTHAPPPTPTLQHHRLPGDDDDDEEEEVEEEEDHDMIMIMLMRRKRRRMATTTTKMTTAVDTHASPLLVQEDLKFVLGVIQERFPGVPIYAVGCSAGSSLLARHMGDAGEEAILAGAAFLSPGFDFEEAHSHMPDWVGEHLAARVRKDCHSTLGVTLAHPLYPTACQSGQLFTRAPSGSFQRHTY
jgi:hypothetical protein